LPEPLAVRLIEPQQQLFTVTQNGLDESLNFALASKVIAGSDDTCIITTTGGVKCWGNNSEGQLGDNTRIGRLTAVDVVGLDSGVTAVSSSPYESGHCAVTSSGGLKCWGLAEFWGDARNGNKLIPTDTAGFTEGVKDVLGTNSDQYSSSTCVLTTTGGVKCWGYNSLGNVGDGTTTNRANPVDVVGLTSGVAAISGSYSSGAKCALTKAGGVKCWGANFDGQIGDGTTTRRLTPVDVDGLASGVKAISVGPSHACAITTLGGVKCWGNNTFGELGDGTTTNRMTPVDVSGLTIGVAAIATGSSYTCAVTTAGAVKCWGNNAYGQLGDGTRITRLFPVDVIGLSSGIADISSVQSHTCALTTGAGVKCWGYNYDAQLGDENPKIDSYIPVDVMGVSGAAPVCKLTAAYSPTLGTGTYTLTASCTPAATSYVWTGGNCAGITGATCIVTPLTSTTYTAAGTDSVGTGIASSAAVTCCSLSGKRSEYSITQGGTSYTVSDHICPVDFRTNSFGYRWGSRQNSVSYRQPVDPAGFSQTC